MDQLADLVAIDKRIADINRQIKVAVKATDTSLPDIFGVGPVVTVLVLGEVRNVARFRNRHHFASYNASAPTLWGSGGDARPMVNLRGNRQLNCALHIVALAQMRHPGPGRDYYLRKIAQGKTEREALRCLKRRISDTIYRTSSPTPPAQQGAREGRWGRLCHPARLTRSPQSALRTSHSPGSPLTLLPRSHRCLDTEGCRYAPRPRPGASARAIMR